MLHSSPLRLVLVVASLVTLVFALSSCITFFLVGRHLERLQDGRVMAVFTMLEEMRAHAADDGLEWVEQVIDESATRTASTRGPFVMLVDGEGRRVAGSALPADVPLGWSHMTFGDSRFGAPGEPGRYRTFKGRFGDHVLTVGFSDSDIERSRDDTLIALAWSAIGCSGGSTG